MLETISKAELILNVTWNDTYICVNVYAVYKTLATKTMSFVQCHNLVSSVSSTLPLSNQKNYNIKFSTSDILDTSGDQEKMYMTNNL